jgi:hypothetical protein
MTTITKTLQATLAPPTTHKERKLRETLVTLTGASASTISPKTLSSGT